MVEAKTRRFATVLALIAGVALSGCEVSQDGDPAPPPPTETFTALFFSTTSLGTPYIPWPTDLMFGGTTDGTVNVPTALQATPYSSGLLSAINTLDGFSITAPITTYFSRPIDGSTLAASNVRVVELNLVAPGTPSSTAPVRRVLAQGTDYKVEVSGDIDSGGKILKITPLKPLKYSKGASGIGYLVLVTNGVTDTSGQAAQPDQLYSGIKGVIQTGGPGCDAAFTDPTQNGICKTVQWQLAIGQAVGFDPSDVVVSWSFMTQSIDDTFEVLAQTVGPQPIGVVPTPLTTAAIGGQGKANIYVGTTVVPYYARVAANTTDRSVLSSFWVAAGPPPAPWVPDARIPFNPLTRYNPVPAKQGGDETIPLLVTVPNATANTANGGPGCTKPEAGWPVVIFQHGITRNRSDALAMADSFADACFVVAAIDLPFHGITATDPAVDPTAALYQAGNERTFDLDLVNNTTGASASDGKIDASGTHYFNSLVSNPIVGRDVMRQGEVDLGVLAKSLGNLDVNGDAAPDVDATRIHFTGLSMGAIVGIAHAKFSPGIRTAFVSAPGGPMTLIGSDSATFGPRIRAALGAASTAFVPNSTFWNMFQRDSQTLLDPGDPINHICECSVSQPLVLVQVTGDAVVPNSATQALVKAGDLRQVKTVGANPVGVEGVWVNFIKGDHGTLINPAASLAATVEMQTQAVKFAASAVQPGGPYLVIADKTVVEAQ